MGIALRATTLIVAIAVVTLSSAANAHYRDPTYSRPIRWCSGPSPAFGLPYFYPCGRHRYHYSDAYGRYYSGRQLGKSKGAVQAELISGPALPASWNELYLMLGTSSAALIGLLFVALSLHLAEIANEEIYRLRAQYTT